MNTKIFSVKNEKSAEFPFYDGHAWYKEVSEAEFSKLSESGKIHCAGGRFFATSSFTEARAAAADLPPAPDEFTPKPNPIPAEVFDDNYGGLYGNPGRTLKGIATVIFILGAIASFVLAFVFGKTTSLWGYSEFNLGLFAGILIGGLVLSYLSGLGLAAFGDLVLSANEINKKLKK